MHLLKYRAINHNWLYYKIIIALMITNYNDTTITIIYYYHRIPNSPKIPKIFKTLQGIVHTMQVQRNICIEKKWESSKANLSNQILVFVYFFALTYIMPLKVIWWIKLCHYLNIETK